MGNLPGMGVSCSYRPCAARMIELEMLSWPVNNAGHSLEINEERRLCSRFVTQFKDKLSLCKVQCENGGIEGFWHYFITDGVLVLEFGDERWSGMKEPNFTVQIHSLLPKSYVEEKTFEKTSTVAERMHEVCGAVGYSLCFRNSEHVARYICNGVWTSAQMLPGAVLYKPFERYMDEHHHQLVNTKPHELVKRKAQQALYPEVLPFVAYERSPNALDKQDLDAFNIVFLGPTGCGKSHLVNQYFNRTVSLSAGSAESVTRDIQIFMGNAMLAKPPTDGSTGGASQWQPLIHDWHLDKRKVNLVDTIGLCDSALPAVALQDLIKQKLKGNFIYIDRVVIVCAGRIELGHQEAILQFMKWLDFERHKANFTFVYNKADTLDEEEREQNLFQMCKLLKTGDVVRSCTESLLPSSSLVRRDPSAPDTVSEAGSTVAGEKPKDDGSDYADPPNTGKQRQVCNRYALGFPPRASFAEVERDMENLLNSTLAPLDANNSTSQPRIRLSEESCAIL